MARRTTETSPGAAVQALARAHRGRLSTLLAPHGLHAGQDLLLLAVWASPGMRQSELARHLGVEPPTVTRMLQRMERGGLIERRPDPQDGRAVLVHPTPRSRLLESTVRRAWTDLDELLVALLGASDAERLARLAATAADGLTRRD